MLQTVNHTRFPMHAAPTVAPDGEHVWTVVVKVTYVLGVGAGGAGRVRYDLEPEDVVLAPSFAGDATRSTLLRDAEMAYEHPGTDVLLYGAAHPPAEASECVVRLRVGDFIDKSLRVVGDRRWHITGDGGLALGEPRPFRSKAITWENAYGGVDTSDAARVLVEERNPAGVGYVGDWRALDGQRAPNVEPVGAKRDAVQGMALEPAGYCAIAPSWLPRRPRAGTYDERWRREKAPFLPDDFDAAFHACAPDDQRVPERLRGGERVVLENLVPGASMYELRVPRERLSVYTEMAGRMRRDEPVMDRLILEPDRRRMVVVWRASIRCGGDVRVVRASRVFAKLAPSRLPPVGSGDRGFEEVA
jgi:hypothetical protein